METFRGWSAEDLLGRFPPYDRAALEGACRAARDSLHRTVVVLDDDPTGTQTVSGVPVVTGWDTALLTEALREGPRMLFILTNSRALTADGSRQLHRELAGHLLDAAAAAGRELLLVSRGDSTLRGHYPLETETLRQVLEARTGRSVDGELLCPFFQEGGRYTAGDVHYLLDQGRLLPVGESEFAGDKTFGYRSSHLGQWIEEKGGGPAGDVRSITLEDLRAGRSDRIQEILRGASGFQKIIVNAVSYEDLERFLPELYAAIGAGKQFLLRTAASILRVMAGCGGGLLSREDLVDRENRCGGIVLVGSHVRRTTRQLDRLLAGSDLLPLEFNQHLALDLPAFEAEIRRVSRAADEAVRRGRSVAVYTRRQRLDLNTADREEELRLAARISQGVVRIISGLQVRPNFIVAKGGITSSDVATRGLGLRRAEVLGQILPGIPVWRAGAESRFPGMPYVIFPGNVGDDDGLLRAVRKLSPGPGAEEDAT